MSLKAIQDSTVRKLLGNRCLSYATLAINAGSAATIKTTGTTTFSVDGILYTKAALSAQSFAITHDQFGRDVSTLPSLAAYVQPANTTVMYIVALNASGTVAVVQGGYAGQVLNLEGGVYTCDGRMPDVPSGYTAIGVVKIATGATTFTPATTALDAANVTATYYNVSVLPSASL